jgi:transposase
MMGLRLPGIIDHHIPQHHLQIGWVATIWLSHIISQGDHQKLTVHDWVNQVKVSSAPCFHTSRSLQNRQKWIKAACFKTALLNDNFSMEQEPISVS